LTTKTIMKLYGHLSVVFSSNTISRESI